MTMHLRNSGLSSIALCGSSSDSITSDLEYIDCSKCLRVHEELNPPKSYGDTDLVNHPQHYTSLPNGIECIQITQFFNFNLGNAIKYIWKAGKKTTDPVQDLQKAMKYLEFEIERIKNHGTKS